MENYLERLNQPQLEAVMTTEGPVLVIAGAGSGKTTVLASRVTYILEHCDVRPWNVLAITFTNKAANEMRERIARYIGEDKAREMWIGTFHSVCVRILRSCIERMGYSKEFSIYDTTDTKTLVKSCIKELDIDEKSFPPRLVQTTISNAKNDMLEPEDFTEEYSRDIRMSVIARIYTLYQKKLRDNNAVDFDDLILLTVKALRDNEDIRDKYRERFQYILVDEYQDTNNTQYELVRLLTNEKNNICVVGDDDQSIYAFRGANINNILDFEKDFKSVKRITLDENYRSVANILNTANAVIANNKKRMGKNLWTSKGDGELISVYNAPDEREEAKYIAYSVHKEFRKRERYSDCTVLYRTNAQSRVIEEAFMYEGIPHKVLAGHRFYDRKEIKDVFAYLKLVYNPGDSVALTRIINEPKRKIGDATINKIMAHAESLGTTMYDIIVRHSEFPDIKSANAGLTAFSELMERVRLMAMTNTCDVVLRTVVEDSGYRAMLENEGTVEAEGRLENVEEFINVAREYCDDPETDGSLEGFIEKISLMSDIDQYDEDADAVNLMTIHSAKGLEFPVVIIAGMEEELFPSVKSFGGDTELEEERRLCYVAITRAKEKLYLTRASSRFKYGFRTPCEESRFLREIPSMYIDDMSPASSSVRRVLESRGVSIMPEIQRYEAIQKKSVRAVSEYDFKPGDRVRHRKFGDGTVVSSQAIGKDAIVVTDFDSVGSKRLMAAFAKLELIERGDGK